MITSSPRLSSMAYLLAVTLCLLSATLLQGQFTPPSGGTPTLTPWGSINGDIANQTDLASQLNLKQPLDNDLTAVANLTTKTFGLSLLTTATAAEARSALGLSTLAATGAWSNLTGVPQTVSSIAGFSLPPALSTMSKLVYANSGGFSGLSLGSANDVLRVKSSVVGTELDWEPISAVAWSGAYADLSGKLITRGDGGTGSLLTYNSNADPGYRWTVSDNSEFRTALGLHTVAATGSYGDLTNQPTSWAFANITGVPDFARRDASNTLVGPQYVQASNADSDASLYFNPFAGRTDWRVGQLAGNSGSDFVINRKEGSVWQSDFLIDFATGNLKIGNTANPPTCRLDVDGSANISGGLTVSNQAVVLDNDSRLLNVTQYGTSIPLNALRDGGATQGKLLAWDNADGWIPVDAPNSAVWGGITGTIASQTDLVNELAAKAGLTSNTYTGEQSAPAFIISGTGSSDSLGTSQVGLGWRDTYFTLATPVGDLQFYNSGTPSEPSIYWPGKIIAEVLAGTVTGSIDAANLIAGPIPNDVLAPSLPAPLYGWQTGVGYAGAAGLTYALDGGSMQPTAGTYFPQAYVEAGTPPRTVQGRYRTAAEFRTDLGITNSGGDMLKTDNLSGLADNSTARTNLGLAAVAATGSADDLTGTLSNDRLSSSVVVAGRTTFNKSAISIAATARYVAQTGTYTPGTDSLGYTVATLPDASAVPAGQSIIICDESDSLRPWYAIRVMPNGSQKIDGLNAALDMVWPGQTVRLVCNGTNGWKTETSWPVPNNALLPQQGGRRDYTCYEDDCYFGWSMAGSSDRGVMYSRNAGSSCGIAGIRSGSFSRGALSLYLGATATSSYNSLAVGGSGGSSGSLMRGELGTLWCEWRVKLPAASTTDYSGLRVGLQNNWDSDYSTDTQDGVYWEANTSGGNWSLKTANSNSRTSNDAQVAYVGQSTDEWLHLAVEWDAAGGKAYFFRCIVSNTGQPTMWAYGGMINTNVPGVTRSTQPAIRRGWLGGAANGGGDIVIDRVRACIIPNTTYARIP